MARAGETVELAERAVTIEALDLVEWDGSEPDRPIAILDVRCSAGTYIRALARDLGAALGSAAYLGALRRTAAGPFSSDDAIDLEVARAAAADGPAGLVPLLRPIDDGLDRFPVVELTIAEVAAVSRGQFIRPEAGFPGDAGTYRLRAPSGALVALADRRRDGPPHARQGPRVQPGRRLMQLVIGVDGLRDADGPIFAVIGVFDGIHLGHRYLLDALGAAAAEREARPTVITFDHHPDEVLTGTAPPLLLDPGERLARLAECGVEVTVVQHFDESVRRTPYDAFVERIRARTRLAGLLMTPDAAFGFERRGTPGALAELGARDDFDVVIVPPFELDGRSVRSSDVRAAIAAGDLVAARELMGRPLVLRGTAHDGALAFAQPMALPPDGAYPCEVDGRPARLELADGAARVSGAGVADGPLEVRRSSPSPSQPGLPQRLGDAALVVLEAGHHEERVAQPVQVRLDERADRLLAGQGHGLALGAATDRPRDVELGRAGRAARAAGSWSVARPRR